MNINKNIPIVNGVSLSLVSYMTHKTLMKITDENDLMTLPTTGDRMSSASMVADIVTDSVQSAVVARGEK